jgi:hypothetical protein
VTDPARTAHRPRTGSGLRGILGRPYVPLDGLLDLAPLDAVHDEICLALAQMPVDYTGGSHRSMGIMPPDRAREALVDYGEVIAGLDGGEFERFRSLADDPRAIDPARRATLTFGEERDVPLSRRQMLWLKYRHGVYFPWKVYVELIPNRWWGDKSSAEGKRFTRLAETLFPQTVAFVRSLPFEHVGRCNVMGLEAHDYGTVHRDGDPDAQESPDQFITFCPRGDKTLYLWDAVADARTTVTGRAYWFNDHDYHGVDPAPRFRYSVRVDGVFRRDFYTRIVQECGGKS